MLEEVLVLIVVKSRYLRGTSMVEVFKQLARDLAGFFEECGGGVGWGYRRWLRLFILILPRLLLGLP
jgi:hypothetical protein